MAMDTLAILLSSGSLAVSLLSLLVSFQAKRQAKSAALLGHRREGIGHVRNAIYDVTVDGNITTKTVDSIRDALQLSSLVFSRRVSNMLDGAHQIAFRLEGKPFDQKPDKDEKDNEALAEQLEAVLTAMNKEAELGK